MLKNQKNYDLALVNGEVFVEGKLINTNVYVKDGKIAGIWDGQKPASKKIDCTGLWILPGMIDSHVHFRQPGMEEKEDWITGSKAALAGGVTTVIDMPNTNPPLTTVAGIAEKKKLAEKGTVNYAFHFGATADNLEEMEKATEIVGFKVYMGSSTGSLLLTDRDKLLAVFKLAAKKKIPAVVHAEDDTLIKKATEEMKKQGRNDPIVHSEARPVEAAVQAVKTALELTEKAGNRLHLLHITTAAEIELIAEAKKRGIKVTFEACPHHLFYNKEAMKKMGNYLKMNTPLRGEADRRVIYAALKDGSVDTVGTDHAPHTRAQKDKPFWEAPSGVPGVQTCLPLLLSEVAKGELSLKRVVSLYSEKPAEIFGFKKKGKITKGYDADLAIVDPNKEYVIKDEDQYTKCGWTPFNDWKVKGKIELTIVGGKIAYDAKNPPKH